MVNYRLGIPRNLSCELRGHTVNFCFSIATSSSDLPSLLILMMIAFWHLIFQWYTRSRCVAHFFIFWVSYLYACPADTCTPQILKSQLLTHIRSKLWPGAKTSCNRGTCWVGYGFLGRNITLVFLDDIFVSLVCVDFYSLKIFPNTICISIF